MAPPHSARERRRLAGLAAFLYALLVLALPGLHLSFHHDDHDHEGGGLRLHEGGLHDDDDDDDGPDAPAHHDHDHGGPGHHGAGLAHYASALLPALAILCPPAPLPLSLPAPRHGADQVVRGPLRSAHGARAPPRSA